MNEEKMVPDSELAAIVRDVQPEEGFEFHRVQEGYPDGVPRAVFIGPDDEPIGIQMSREAEPLRFLVGRLAADLATARRNEPKPWERLRAAATAMVEAYEDSDVESLDLDAFEQFFEGLDEALADIATAEEESASRGEIPDEVRAAALPEIQSPITDAAIDAAIEQAKAKPKAITREEAQKQLRAHGVDSYVIEHFLAHPQRELDTRARLSIEDPVNGILRAYMLGLAEEPPTQPPQRERCKPIAGPWTDGVMTYDERGLMLASASKTTEGVVVCVNRPHLSAEVFHTATEYEAMTAIRERLATWCDVTALAIPEAP